MPLAAIRSPIGAVTPLPPAPCGLLGVGSMAPTQPLLSRAVARANVGVDQLLTQLLGIAGMKRPEPERCDASSFPGDAAARGQSARGNISTRDAWESIPRWAFRRP